MLKISILTIILTVAYESFGQGYIKVRFFDNTDSSEIIDIKIKSFCSEYEFDAEQPYVSYDSKCHCYPVKKKCSSVTYLFIETERYAKENNLYYLIPSSHYSEVNKYFLTPYRYLRFTLSNNIIGENETVSMFLSTDSATSHKFEKPIDLEGFIDSNNVSYYSTFFIENDVRCVQGGVIRSHIKISNNNCFCRNEFEFLMPAKKIEVDLFHLKYDCSPNNCLHSPSR